MSVITSRPSGDTVLSNPLATRLLPSFSELVRGKPLIGGSPVTHAAALATGLLVSFSGATKGFTELRQTLVAVEVCPRLRVLTVAVKACRSQATSTPERAGELLEAAAQFEYLSATMSNPIAAGQVALEAIARADATTTPDGEALDLVTAALGWLSVAAAGEIDSHGPSARSRAFSASDRIFDRFASAWRERISALALATEHVCDADPETLPRKHGESATGS